MTTATAPAQLAPADLAVIGPPTTPQSSKPDAKALEEENAYAQAEQELKLEGIRQDLRERKDYAKRIFFLICCWLGGMFVLLVLQGILGPWKFFELSDAVIMAAIGGTTVNVLGIFIIVVNYLFPKR